MFISDYLSNDFPTFSLDENAAEAYLIARELQYSHIFIVENERYLGALSIYFIEESQGDDTLKSQQLNIERYAILENESLLNVIPLFNQFLCNVIPVINDNENYLGYLSTDDFFNELSKSALFGEDGVTLIIQHNNLHYSLAEVTRIVESNNAKVYGCYVSEIFNDYVHITLKISEHNLGFIRDDFNRYGYEIVHLFYHDQSQELLKERFNFVQKYLEL